MNGLVVVLSGFPRRSETFAIPELEALDRAGLLAGVFATKAGDGLVPHEDAARLASRVVMLRGGSAAEQADEIVRALDGQRPTAVHGYFAHQPAAVAECVAERLSLPFGFSVHARDARKVPAAALRARGRRAACVVACNRDAHDGLLRLGVSSELVPHGVNLARFRPSPMPPACPLRILAVGRLVPKKGFDVLLRALAELATPCELDLVGDGPEAPALRALAAHLGVTSAVRWHGSLAHDTLPPFYRAAHLVVVPSVVDEMGDRDGLPNVVLEALASERVVVASRVGAIESAVADGVTGATLPPGDPNALARRIEELARNLEMALAIAKRGRMLAEQHFDVARCTRRFVDTLGACYA